MRTKTIVAMAVLASVTLAGCNKDNDNEMEVDRVKDTPMIFLTSVNQSATRAGYETGELPTDAIFGLTITTPGGETDIRFTQKNKQMTYDTSKWIEKGEATKLLWKSSETEVAYIAYVPYSANAWTSNGDASRTYSVTVPSDQTSEQAIKDADFLYTIGTAKGAESTAGIPLAFKHMLSQLKITLARGSEVADGVTFTAVELTTCCALATTIDLTDGVVTPATAGQTSSITLLDNAGKTTFECVLVPQTFTNTLKVTIEASDGKTYVYTSNEALSFASGKTYTLPLIVGRDKVEVGTITVKPWIDADGGELETE